MNAPIKYYHAPECDDFEDSKYKKYWAFLWLLNCTDQQLQDFRRFSYIAFDDFIWAYDFLVRYFGPD